MAAMHQTDEFISKFFFGKNHNTLYFRFDLHNELRNDDSIKLKFVSPMSFSIEFKAGRIELNSDKEIFIQSMIYAIKDIIELSVSSSKFDEIFREAALEAIITTSSGSNIITYPRQGFLKLQF